ncbi:MAG: cytochrome c3 family protein [Nitrospirae bacterium]|nr:cytochrome c3 family protein [Nitrospirota bacterium]
MKKLLLIIIFLAISALIAYTVRDNPHSFSEEECSRCHVDAVNFPQEMIAPITQLCLPCHKKTTQRSSHPVDIAPEMVRVPADLPLINGMITCNTCHNIHESRLNAFGEKTYFLRRPAPGRDFCISCHEAKLTNNSHIELIAYAHMKGKYTVTDKSQPLDSLSMDCIGCHDGSVGKSVGYAVGKGVWNHQRGSHPVGVNYRESRMRKGELKPVEKLSKKIRLFSGNIGCGTCHDVYSKIPMQLVMSNDGSRLCFACHIK